MKLVKQLNKQLKKIKREKSRKAWKKVRSSIMFRKLRVKQENVNQFQTKLTEYTYM